MSDEFPAAYAAAGSGDRPAAVVSEAAGCENRATAVVYEAAVADHRPATLSLDVRCFTAKR
jgi:hypothetical protein